MSALKEKVGYQQGGRSCSRGYRKAVKSDTKRLIRRAGKRDPENAPRRVREVTRGWYT